MENEKLKTGKERIDVLSKHLLHWVKIQMAFKKFLFVYTFPCPSNSKHDI